MPQNTIFGGKVGGTVYVHLMKELRSFNEADGQNNGHTFLLHHDLNLADLDCANLLIILPNMKVAR